MELALQEEVSLETQENLKEIFNPFFDQAQQWKEKADGLVVSDSGQVELIKQAREARLALKNIRVDVEKKRKELKEESLRKGKAIDGMANVIKYLIQPIEKHLQDQEDFPKIQEAKIKAQLKEDRQNELSKYEIDTSFFQLDEMDEESYLQLLENSRIAYEEKKKEQQRLENLKIESERLDAIERKREIEIAPYASFIGDTRIVLRDMTDADYKSLLSNLKKAKSDHEAEQNRIREENQKLKAEQEKLRIANEKKLQKQKKENEAKLKKEREAKEKIEAELKAKRDAENKAELARRKEAEDKAKKEKEARLAPDKQKLQELAKTIVDINLPEVKSEEAKNILKSVQELLNKTSNYIKEKTIEL